MDPFDNVLGRTMNIGLGSARRTILLIDADPHSRAALRLALEGAGFSVGEAANDEEGERTALRIGPDAIVAELMTDRAHGAMGIGERLLAHGDRTIPCFIVSTAADALMGAVGLHEMGITGVFLKPIDPAIVIQALRTRLGSGPRTPEPSGLGHA
jgi:DNA-binding response OmpR family regulator